MSTLWTTIIYIVVGAPVVLAGYMLVRWFGFARHHR